MCRCLGHFYSPSALVEAVHFPSSGDSPKIQVSQLWLGSGIELFAFFLSNSSYLQLYLPSPDAARQSSSSLVSILHLILRMVDSGSLDGLIGQLFGA